MFIAMSFSSIYLPRKIQMLVSNDEFVISFTVYLLFVTLLKNFNKYFGTIGIPSFVTSLLGTHWSTVSFVVFVFNFFLCLGKRYIILRIRVKNKMNQLEVCVRDGKD
jgi:hypothetical protein